MLILQSTDGMDAEQDLQQRVRSYYDEHGTLLVLKPVDKDNEQSARIELRVLQRLLTILSSRNHTIPAEIVPCSATSVVVMPWLNEITFLSWHSLDTLTDVIRQVLEASNTPCFVPPMLINCRALSSCMRMGSLTL